MSVKVDRNNLNRKVFALNDFRGVDYASSPLEVKPYRATDMANLLLRDGMLKKRHGFRQVHKINGASADSEFKVHKPSSGSYFLVEEHRKDENPMFHTMKESFGVVEYVQSQAVDGSYFASINIDRYIYIYGSYEIIKFDGNTGEIVLLTAADYYTPTTTINIPLSRYDYGTDGTEVDTDVQFPYTSNESVNMLTRRVRNSFLVRPSSIQAEANKSMPYFKLDGTIPSIRNSGFTLDALPSIKVADGDGFADVGAFEVKDLVDVVAPEYDNIISQKCLYNATIGVALCEDGAEVEGIGKSTLVVVDNGKFKLFLKKTAKQTDFADTDGVRFREFFLEYPNDTLGFTNGDITSCTTAITFGVDGANDRIFLAGGVKQNMVYISENDVNYKPNPTYFPADQFLVCGLSNAPISGFMRVTDGTLAVFKDVKSVEDVAVYYVSGSYVDVGTGEEGNTYQQARFSVKAGDIARVGISARAIANLDGDNIFTSAEGVYGIQLSSNVASGERYAKERSRTINPKISKMGLNNAKGIVFEDKYYLAVDGGEVYVADARYKFTLKGDQQNTFNYEWFRLTDLYVKEWFVLYDRLYFIDKNGYICAFTERYADEYMRTSDRGELTVNDGTVTFIANEDRELVESSAFAVDYIEKDGKEVMRTWELKVTEYEGKPAIAIPDDINIQAGDTLTLWFCKPINAYWQSSVLALDNAMMRKNMWSMSMTVNAEQGGRVDLGYKTRFTHKEGIEVQGVNASLFGDMNFIGGVSFDNGGYLGINTYRFRVFERGFTHLQLLFRSDTTDNCAVGEIDVEYSITIKNIGVG